MSDIKLMHGDFFPISMELPQNSFNLIIADINWTMLWNYEFVFKRLMALLKHDGFLAVTVDSSRSILALVVYLEIGSNLFDINEVAVFEDGEWWGNVIIFMHKRKQMNTAKPRLPPIIHLEKGTGPHPNSKDKKLYGLIVEKFSNEGDNVLDPFMGEGNTGRVCQEMNRNYVGIEIEKNWYDEATKR